MSVTTTHNRVDYVADGVQTQFAYTFLIFAASDLQVFVDNVLQTLTTHYTVSNVGNPNGGNVTFVSAPAAGAKIAIVRATPYDQQTVFVDNDKFPAASINNALDKLTILTQQLLEKVGRALTFATSSTLTGITVPEGTSAANRASKFLRWNSAGDGLEIAEVTDAGTYINPITTKGDLVVGDANGDPARLPAGANNQVLISDPAQAVGLRWRGISGLLGTFIFAKGDLITHNGADASRLAVGADRAILEADSAKPSGVTWATRALGLKSVQVFTSSGTWNRPTGIRRVLVMVQGAGGGGGGVAAQASPNESGGGGGGGGGCAIRLIDVTGIASATITVGAGGTAGAAGNNPGDAGGNSSWVDGVNTVTGNGGAGGGAGPGGAGGAGGTATGGHLNIAGQPGGGIGVTTISSVNLGETNHGGSAHLGSGGFALRNAAGGAGGQYGGGGAGGFDAEGNTARAGGAGASGVVVVWEYE